MVECHLAKVDVEGSNPFSRSLKAQVIPGLFAFPALRCRSKLASHDHQHDHFWWSGSLANPLAALLVHPARQSCQDQDLRQPLGDLVSAHAVQCSCMFVVACPEMARTTKS